MMDWKESSGLFQKKKQNVWERGIESILFGTSPPSLFRFLTLIPGNSRQIKASRLETPPNCVTSLRNFKYTYSLHIKPRLLEIPHDFFLITPGNSMSGNFTCYFFNIPGNSISSPPSLSSVFPLISVEPQTNAALLSTASMGIFTEISRTPLNGCL